MSDEDGIFRANLPPGEYWVKATYVGYCDSSQLIYIKDSSETKIFIGLPAYCKYDKNRKYKLCPVCNKEDMTIPIVYGLLVRKGKQKLKKGKDYIAGDCLITCCDPTWYCKRDKYSF